MPGSLGAVSSLRILLAVKKSWARLMPPFRARSMPVISAASLPVILITAIRPAKLGGVEVHLRAVHHDPRDLRPLVQHVPDGELEHPFPCPVHGGEFAVAPAPGEAGDDPMVGGPVQGVLRGLDREGIEYLGIPDPLDEDTDLDGEGEENRLGGPGLDDERRELQLQVACCLGARVEGLHRVDESRERPTEIAFSTWFPARSLRSW